MTHSAVVAFGRNLQPRFGFKNKWGGNKKCAAILVLDHAERLLSLSPNNRKNNNNNNEKRNHLAELLLLPQVMRLNLTIIAISSHAGLNGSRLNNIVSPGKSLATISSGVHPIVLQFPAYKGNDVFKQILWTRHLQQQIVGDFDDDNDDETTTTTAKKKTSPFWKKTMDAFLNSLIQFISDSTRDPRDFVRLGRSLWPLFVEPLARDRIDETMKSLQQQQQQQKRDSTTTSVFSDNNDITEGMEHDLLSFLGQKFFAAVSKVSGSDLCRISMDSPCIPVPRESGKIVLPERPARFTDVPQPYLRNCLLLAAFICQHNRREQDQKVFSVQGNGKRKSSSRGKENSRPGEEDDVAFSSFASDIEQLWSLRPRPFSVERFFAMFVLLVSLNHGGGGRTTTTTTTSRYEKKNADFKAEILGNTRLFDDLNQLVNFGYLHPIGYVGSLRAEQMNFNGAKFWCSLTKEEAFQIADNCGIPLVNYLV